MISRKAIRQFQQKRPDSKTALDAWYALVKRAKWKNLPDAKADFPSADLVGRRTVFNIKGNSYRLIARVSYRTQCVFVLHILTHTEVRQRRLEAMSAAARAKSPTIDPQRYGRLLSHTRPRPIRNDKELDAMTAELLRLDELVEAGKASPEQEELAELLTTLIVRYEDERYPVKMTAPPHELLAASMELRGVSQADLANMIGSRSLASEILSGKREISKTVAKQLAESLRAPVELFL